MYSFGTVKSTVLDTAPSVIVGPSIKRTALLFTPAKGKRYTISTDPAVSLDGGLTLFDTAGPIEITLERHGDVVRKAWYGVAEDKVVIGFLETVAE